MVQKKRKERITDAEKKEAYKEASKFVLDIAKLILAGTILGTITQMELREAPVIIVSTVALLVFSRLGAYLYYISIKRF